ncbi:unnamed protein product, partial [Protopolystoma xenopodis]
GSWTTEENGAWTQTVTEKAANGEGLKRPGGPGGPMATVGDEPTRQQQRSLPLHSAILLALDDSVEVSIELGGSLEFLS